MSSNLFLNLSKKAAWVAAKMNSLILEPLTTDEMNNLSEVHGRVIYNKDDNLLHLYTENDEWIPLGTAGEQGPTGPTGASGSPGSTGPTGPSSGGGSPNYYQAGLSGGNFTIENGQSPILNFGDILADETDGGIQQDPLEYYYAVNGTYLMQVFIQTLLHQSGTNDGKLTADIKDYYTFDTITSTYFQWPDTASVALGATWNCVMSCVITSSVAPYVSLSNTSGSGEITVIGNALNSYVIFTKISS